MLASVRKRLRYGMVAALFAALFIAIPQTASAAESMPELQWPPADVNAYQYKQMTTSPQGDVTIGCDWLPSSSQDLITYDATGTVVREISQTSQIDGKSHCIMEPVADKNGDIYGTVRSGTNLLAYDGDTLKWKYPFGCTVKPVVGADGNIYAVNSNSRLIGLSPELDAGQTQPTKVLDIPIGTGCGSEVQAFENGLAVSSFSTLHYYGYDGTDLGEPPGTYWQDRSFPVNADGRLFFPVKVEGIKWSGQFSAYDPLTQEVAWTTQVSTPGASVSSFESLPVPGGGAIFIIKQQKMTSDNVPATPAETVYRLVALSSGGVEKWSKELPNTDSDGNRYTSYPHSAVDTSGKIVIIRELRLQLSSSQVPVIEISTFDTITGDTIYHEEMRGNTDTASGPTYGYDFASATSELTIGPNTLYLNAMQCTTSSSCYYGDLLLHAVKVPGLGLDYPRGALLREPIGSLDYVAMGDSFSSGEGVEPFEPGTAEPGVNECHRSELAYARILDQDPELTLNLENGGFVACSGATTASITLGYNGEGAQIDHVSSDTDVITMSIGGNNMPFSDFAVACVMPGTASCDEDAYDNAMAGIANNVTPRVEYMLEALRDRLIDLGSDATVLVVGYPQLVPDTWVSTTAGCWWLQPDELPAIRDVTSTLNVAIKNEVDAIGGNFHFVSPEAPDSPFIGHELCRNTSDPEPSYFLNYDSAAPQVYTFHPDDLGQQAYAELIASYLAQRGLS